MLRSIRKFSIICAFTGIFAACADESRQMEEPLDADQVDDDPSSSDENAGSLEGADGGAYPSEPRSEEESMSDDAEAAEDGVLSEPGAAMPEAAPSEKGGIISSGVKDKKRCRLIADELERQKCLRQQAK